ncbi:MAG: sugar phosphate nucleotidyltransferase [Ferruginibacter sp.]
MKAMIFAAGLGTRFKPWTDHHPKALAIVNGKSLLQRNIEYLQEYGISEVVVNVHHFSEQIIDAIQKSKGWGSQIQISDESDAVLETGGGLLKAAPLLAGQEPFITLNADFLTNLHLNNLLAFHNKQQSFITLAVTRRESSRGFLMDEQMRLCGWKNQQTGEEKIKRSSSTMNLFAYSCVAVFDPAIFDTIPQTGKFSLTETYLSLANQYCIMGYEHSGDKLIDVGKPESVAEAERLFI